MAEPYGYIDYSKTEVDPFSRPSEAPSEEEGLGNKWKTQPPDDWDDVQIATAVREARYRF